jgi:hypothetical protein
LVQLSSFLGNIFFAEGTGEWGCQILQAFHAKTVFLLADDYRLFFVFIEFIRAEFAGW